MMNRTRTFLVISASWLTVLNIGCQPSSLTNTGQENSDRRPKVGYVTNGIASFWTIAEHGARAAASEFDVELFVRMPTADGAVGNQKRIIEELLSMEVDGMAVSPIDPDNQVEILNTAARKCILLTQDSDAPQTSRVAYIGMNNYDAGRLCGGLVQEAMPAGGSVIIFLGRLEQLNARQRRQGVIDAVLDRPYNPENYDEPGTPLRGDKYVILDTRADNFDFAASKSLAEEAIARYPDLGCMVGLFAYNPAYMLEALKGAGLLGKIHVIGFDEQAETLQGIVDGHCYGTVVQNPYEYGYKSVRVLAGLARNDETAMPPNGFLNIPARVIKQDNVKEFWAELKQLVAHN